MAAKIAQYLFTIWLVLTLNFALPRLIPGNPLAELDDPQGLPVPLSEEQRLKLMAYYGLDKPLIQQYQDYVTGLFRADWGWSISYNAPVLTCCVGGCAGRCRWWASPRRSMCCWASSWGVIPPGDGGALAIASC
jgi:ABC-type dipeptide/oligopeptide/nickel transport system permease component